MEYNWADPKKNSKIKSMLMLKAESSRKKRLTSVKSAVSNQMAPGAAQNVLLRKKKRSTDRPDSSREPADEFHLSPEHRTHSGSNGSGARNISSRLHSRNNEALVKDATARLLDDFDSHAAAEGLFHPASMIEAFLEHDTKYVSALLLKPSRVDGSASSTSVSTGEYLPSREHQKLPILGAIDVKKRERLSSRSEVQLQYADSSSRSSLSSTRSDSDLHAPRRTGSVPSSADRSALDFLDPSDEEEGEHDTGNTSADTTKAKRRVPHTRSKTSPPDFKSLSLQSKRSRGGDLDLTSKFDALKQMVKANAKIHGITAYKDEQPRKTKAMSLDVDSTGVVTKQPDRPHHSKEPGKAGTSKKSNVIDEKQSRGNLTQPSKSAATDTIVSAAASGSSRSSKKDSKAHNGVSLSDLKKEHRAALELLQELGGPIDVSELTEEATCKGTITKMIRVSKQVATNRQSSSGHSSSVLSGEAPRQSCTNHDLDRKVPVPRQQSLSQQQQSLSHSLSSGKLVAKLRASVPSGRDKQYKEQSPELDSPVAESPEREEMAQFQERNEPNSTAAAAASYDPISGSIELEQCLREADNESANQAQALIQNERISGKSSAEPAQHALDESWKQYEDDDHDAQHSDEEEGENNDDEDPWTSKLDDALPRSGMSTARSADLYGDEAFENEW